MAADLQPVDVLANVVGVVDGPGGEPEDLALEFAQQAQFVAASARLSIACVRRHGRPSSTVGAFIILPLRWRWRANIGMALPDFGIFCYMKAHRGQYMPKAAPLDDIDRNILRLLQEDGRITLSK